jgi:tetratricopeptide (TPR) repeat protein
MKNLSRQALVAIMLLLTPWMLLCAQSEGGAGAFEKHKESVISYMSLGKEKEIIAKGTGFIIGKETMVTTYSLISQADKVEGLDYRGKKVKIEGIFGVDKNHNIALLKAKSKSPGLPKGDPFAAGQGSTIFAVGSNDTGQLQVVEGTLAKVTEFAPNQRILEILLEAPDTFSGAPVFNKDGQVLGILIFLGVRTKFVLPINLVEAVSKKSSHTKFKDQSTEDYDETLEGSYLSGRVFAALGRNSQAEKYLKKVLSIKPDEMDVHLMLSSIYLSQRNYGNAVSTLKKIIELDPNLDEAHFGLGEVFIKMRKWDEAIAPLEKAVSMNPTHKEAYFLIGNAHQELKAFDKAAGSYNQYISSNPDNPGDAYYNLGLCQMELSQFEQASASLAKALEEKPQDSQVNSKLAEAYQKSGQLDNAAEVYMRLAELNPSDGKFYYSTVIRMYDEAGMTDKAIASLQKMIEINPQDADAIYNLGYMYVKLEKWNEAIATFNQALEARSDFTYAYLQLGYVYSKLKKFKDAVNVYKKLVEIDPGNGDGWMSIGVCHMQLKQYAPAVEPLKKAIELRPENGTAYYNLGIAYLNLQDWEAARNIHKRLVDVDPDLAQKLQKYLR